jgi:hypothetical protein
MRRVVTQSLPSVPRIPSLARDKPVRSCHHPAGHPSQSSRVPCFLSRLHALPRPSITGVRGQLPSEGVTGKYRKSFLPPTSGKSYVRKSGVPDIPKLLIYMGYIKIWHDLTSGVVIRTCISPCGLLNDSQLPDDAILLWRRVRILPP